MAAGELRTFWMLFGSYGPTMTMEQIRQAYFPGVTIKTLQNKAAAGQLPRRTADVFDTRDVADWWDGMRQVSRPGARDR